MPTSSQRTTVAILRAIIGASPERFGELAGCSKYTIKSLEHGRLKLSESLAQRMSRETGVSLRWLLDGDISAPPISNAWETPFTRDTYLQTQADKQPRSEKPPEVLLSINAIGSFGVLRTILSSARESGRYHLAMYKLHEFLKEMREQFGQDLDEGEALLTNSINDYEARAMFAADCGMALAYSDSITKRKPMPQWEELYQRALEREKKTIVEHADLFRVGRATKDASPKPPPSARPSPKRKRKA